MRKSKIAFALFACFLLLHWVLLWLAPLGPILEEKSFSRVVYDRNGKLMRLTLAKDDTYRLFAPLSEMSPYLIRGTLLYEDRYFYWHPGVNPISLVKAFWKTYVLRSRTIGASTITMQLSRYLYDIDSRSILGKIQQIFGALWLEFLYDKEAILEAYLNVAPYGFNIEGAPAASLIYFHQNPDQLTLLKALTLSVMPQSPYERTKNLALSNRANEALKEARGHLLTDWLTEYPSYLEQEADFQLELEMRSPRSLPFHSPHLVTNMLARSEEPRLHLSIDLSAQRSMERILRSYVFQNRKLGIKNAVAMLVDAKSMETFVSIGSADFGDAQIFGQVDGTRARRSPGSTLKPFAFGLAMEEGKIHPQTMIKDAPTPFGTYTPDNFDRQFSGPLSATDALIHSRNIPAVHIAKILEKRRLYDFLKEANIPLNEDPKHYGLSIVLGTAEVTMTELAELYAILVNQGKFKKLKFRAEEPTEPGRQILSAEASHLVREMLAQNPRPTSSRGDRWLAEQKSISWKTGTSVGFRDAWAASVFDHYVMIVWVGNFSGMGNGNFIGRYSAAPLLFRLIDAYGQIGEVNFQHPDPPEELNVTEVEVCALSGHLPGEDCPHKRKSLFIPGVSPITKCGVHKRLKVDVKTGLRVCPAFEGKSKEKTYEFWTSDLLALFQQAGIGRKLPPGLHPSCKMETYGSMAPQIISPKSDLTYSLRSEGTGTKEVPFVAIAQGDSSEISWYVDHRFVGRSAVDAPLLWPAKAGEHIVEAIDDQGRWSSVEMTVGWVD